MKEVIVIAVINQNAVEAEGMLLLVYYCCHSALRQIAFRFRQHASFR